MPPLRIVAIVLLFACLPPSGSRAWVVSVEDIVWDDSLEIVDAPVTEIPSAPGVSAVYWQNQWFIVHEKEGAVYLTGRGLSGWGPAVVVTSGIPARNPHVAGGSHLNVVWEDDREGHAEIWNRRFDGSQWSAEECLSCDGVASHAAVIAAVGTLVFAAWEDSSAAGFTVQSRTRQGGAWGPLEPVSSAPAQGREPTVAYNPGEFPTFLCAWSDYAYDPPRIMMEDGFGSTFLAAGRQPSIHSEQCCGDALCWADAIVAFEATGNAGATETYNAYFECGPGGSLLLSEDDGRSSSRAQAAGFGFGHFPCVVPGGLFPAYVSVWTEPAETRDSAPVTGRQTQAHWISDGSRRQLLTSSGLDGCGLAMAAGNPAHVLAYWIETRDELPTLVARSGHLVGCVIETVEMPPALLLAPEGIPPLSLRAFDSCSGNPLVDYPVQIYFDAALDEALTWDPLQEHPDISETTDDAGIALFALRGGGCSQAGRAYGCTDDWSGAKSPDVDGDCVVRLSDLQYVEDRIGTSDFCADLDGSGQVDQDDLAIVLATLGDHCSDVSEVTDDARPGSRVSFTLAPTPAADAVMLRLASPVDATVEIAIYDAGGRIVRLLPMGRISAGVTPVVWDTRDDAGRPVPSGVYFALLRMSGDALKRPIVVTR